MPMRSNLHDIVDTSSVGASGSIAVIYMTLSPLQLRGEALRWFTEYYDVYNKLSTDTHTCNVGASGSSPAVRTPCPRCMYCGRPSSRPYSYAVKHCGCLQGIVMVYNKLSTDTHTCSVGASGSSPALRPQCLRCVCFGRPSSRPYSYAVEHCGDYQGVIGGIYRLRVAVIYATMVIFCRNRRGFLPIAPFSILLCGWHSYYY